MTLSLMMVRATDVRVGDVVGCSEVDYVVSEIKRVSSSSTPQAVRNAGGWVNLIGDSAEGYFQRHYGGEESYYAMPDEIITIKRDNTVKEITQDEDGQTTLQVLLDAVAASAPFHTPGSTKTQATALAIKEHLLAAGYVITKIQPHNVQ